MFPIDYPTVEVGGRTLVVRYSMAAQVLLVRGGIDPLQLNKLLDKAEPRRVEYLVRLFAACVAENYLDPARPETCSFTHAPTADYWLSQLDLVDVVAIDAAIGESMGKAREALKLKRVPAPPIPIAS